MTLDIDFRLSSSRMNIHVDGRFLKSVIMYTGNYLQNKTALGRRR